VRRIVVDAPAFLGWFAPNGPGRRLRAEYEGGGLTVRVPSVFPLHVLELAHARGVSPERLERLAHELRRIGFETHDPPAAELARWLAKGADSRRAPYAALAADAHLRLVSGDAELLRIAAAVVEPTT